MSAHSVPNDKPVKIPGPDHPITIEQHHARGSSWQAAT